MIQERVWVALPPKETRSAMQNGFWIWPADGCKRMQILRGEKK